jgi:hypothetical protein
VTTRGCGLLLLCLLASGTWGCLLFTDPINTAPTVSVATEDPFGLSRSRTALFTANAFDPNQSTDSLKFDWYQGKKSCDKAPNAALAASSIGNRTFQFQPSDLGSGCVVVVVTDNRGATASATQSYEVVDQAPTAVIKIQNAPGQPEPVVGQTYPLALYSKLTLSGASSTDPDDNNDLKLLTPIWHVFSAESTEITVPGCPDNSKGAFVCTFSATAPGSYRVQLVVNDSNNMQSVAEQLIQVADDQLPTIDIESAQPLPPTSSSASPLLLFANLPNTFTVNRVEDDGDPYPPPALSSSAPASPAGFVWYIRRPNSALFERWIGSGPTFTIPQKFNPQDIVQVRVEYHDRVTACQPRTPGCDAVFAACDPNATICYSSDFRVEWVTWTVEFR